MKQELIILNSMPLPLPSPFWDGQPREADGKFTYGSMPGRTVRISARGLSLPVDNYNEMISALATRLAGPYSHPDCGEYIFGKNGIRHAVRTSPLREKMFAMAHIDRIIAACDLHQESPKDGNKQIKTVWTGSCRVKVLSHVFRAEVFLETAVDNITRFHHLSLYRSDASKRLYESKKIARDSK